MVEQLEALRSAHPGRRLEIWFEDEARFGQQGTLTRVWAPSGSRPRAVRQTRYDYLYVLAAACPQSGQAIGLLAPHLNTGVMNVFLEEFAKELDADVYAVLILGQAGYHTSDDLKTPANVSLLYLPPYSPELNPIENLWHYLRSHHWANRSYQHYDALRAAACDAWQCACLNPEIIKTVCAALYITQRQN